MAQQTLLRVSKQLILYCVIFVLNIDNIVIIFDMFLNSVSSNLNGRTRAVRLDILFIYRHSLILFYQKTKKQKQKQKRNKLIFVLIPAFIPVNVKSLMNIFNLKIKSNPHSFLFSTWFPNTACMRSHKVSSPSKVIVFFTVTFFLCLSFKECTDISQSWITDYNRFVT